MHVAEVSADDEHQGAALLRLQQAAYGVEAEVIGDDRIPPLHESLADLRAASVQWLGAYAHDRLIGAVAWSETPSELGIDRLVVDPGWHRRGTAAPWCGQCSTLLRAVQSLFRRHVRTTARERCTGSLVSCRSNTSRSYRACG